MVLYPFQLMLETVKLLCQSANQPMETRPLEAEEGAELGGAANASGSSANRDRPLEGFIFRNAFTC